MLPPALGDRTVHPLVTSGVAYRLGLVALGQANAALVLPRGNGPALWDWVALAGGLTHHGYQVLGWADGDDLTASRPPNASGGLVAALPEIAEPLRAATTPQHPHDPLADASSA